MRIESSLDSEIRDHLCKLCLRRSIAREFISAIGYLSTQA